MSDQALRLEMIGKVDSTSDKNEYYFTRPDIPVSIDLSECVIFIHPWENDGNFGATMVVKKYDGKRPPKRTKS